MTETSWSYSAFSTAATCLKKYQLIYIDKLAPEYQSGDLEFGSALHLGLNEMVTGGDGFVTFDVFWNTYEKKPLQYGRYKWEELGKIGHEFLRKFQNRYLPKLKLHTAEKRLYAEYKGVKLEGTADMLAHLDGKLHLFDFKTTSYPYEKEKAEVSLQLYLYAYLVKQSLGVTPDYLTYIPFVKSTAGIQTPVSVEFNEETMYKMLDELIAYVTLLKPESAAPVYPKNFNACLGYGRKCEFWNTCHGNGE